MDDRKLRKLLLGEFSVKRMVSSLLFLYACLCLYAFFFTDRLMFPVPPASYRDTEAVIKLTASNGAQVSALYLPNQQADYTLLYSHGNGEDLGYIAPVLQQLQAIGFAVFAYDYQGYGTSQGRASERNTYASVDAAYDYLTAKLGVPSDRIIAYGRSIGGGPTLDLAIRQPLAGVVLESTFVAIFRVVTRIAIVPFDRFDNLRKIRKLRCPVLIIHGKLDGVVPFWHSQRLFEAAPEPKQALWLDQANHNDVALVAAEQYPQTLRQFAERVEQFQQNKQQGK
ncbi:alpha/beta hydrolase [Leptolyngbya sp. FACHB-261]|uniref:alpha/beta hydrolase n=1 Tax=Leptolyngbya sp. FACHB-261 TaxID=2692806 RepID=UPI001687FBA5|nr:alpha/beta hydrolase [Leptolyngbya sp. FACHB-261]MBD2104448.1 alpha/beta hydrolase [Leptolyngbya sp. FACHB-261]